MRKKILIFSQAYYPNHIGGAEVAIKEITDRLPSDEYEFHLVCNRFDSALPKQEIIGQVQVHRIGLVTKNPTMADLKGFPLHLNKLFYLWGAFRVAKTLHQTQNFSGIWAVMAHTSGIPAALFKKSLPKVPYLLTLQEGDPVEYIDSKMRWFGRFFTDAFLLADSVHVISRCLGHWAKSHGFSHEPIIVPNGVAAAHFAQPHDQEVLDEVRRIWGFASEDIILVTTSRLVYKNAVDIIVQSLVLLPTGFKLVIFGTGPEEEKIKKLIKQLNLENRVRLAGQITQEQMPKYLQACNIFVRPSRSEGMGNSFIEAMAAGLPVVATQVGGIADFLFDARLNPDQATTGWAVDVDSPLQIKEAVLAIVAGAAGSRDIVARARTLAITKYDWDIIIAQMREVFRSTF